MHMLLYIIDALLQVRDSSLFHNYNCFQLRMLNYTQQQKCKRNYTAERAHNHTNMRMLNNMYKIRKSYICICVDFRTNQNVFDVNTIYTITN